jgi:hypothetical protein
VGEEVRQIGTSGFKISQPSAVIVELQASFMMEMRSFIVANKQ